MTLLWSFLTPSVLQCARNVQIIAEAVVYNRTRLGKMHANAQCAHIIIPEPCESTLL